MAVILDLLEVTLSLPLPLPAFISVLLTLSSYCPAGRQHDGWTWLGCVPVQSGAIVHPAVS